MTSDRDDVFDALSDSVLADREVLSCALPHSDDVMFAVPCAGLNGIEAWRAARSVRHLTGRHPAINVYGEELDGMARGGYHPDLARPAGEILDEVDSVDVRMVLDGLWGSCWPAQTSPVDLQDCQREVERTRRAFGDAPSAEHVLDAIGTVTKLDDLDRWLLDWEIEHIDPRRSEFVRTEIGYTALDTALPDKTFLCLWPTSQSWQVAAHANYYAAQDREADLCVTLRTWEQQYDAELMGIDSVTMVLSVGNPPSTTDDAWQLAADLIAWGRNYDGTRRHLAEGLLHSPTWYLFERP